MDAGFVLMTFIASDERFVVSLRNIGMLWKGVVAIPGLTENPSPNNFYYFSVFSGPTEMWNQHCKTVRLGNHNLVSFHSWLKRKKGKLKWQSNYENNYFDYSWEQILLTSGCTIYSLLHRINVFNVFPKWLTVAMYPRKDPTGNCNELFIIHVT